MMDDRMTFERQLDAVFASYADQAPTNVDPGAVADAARRLSTSSRSWSVMPVIGVRSRWHLLAATALLALAILGSAALLIGSLRTDQTIMPPRVYEGVFVESGPVGTDRLATSSLIRLSDGRILIFVGSWPDRRQQTLWDPVSELSSPTGVPLGLRQEPTGVLLEDGRVLIVGGDITEPVFADGGYQGEATYSTAEIYDPATGNFSAAGPMAGKGWAPSAIRLADGRVLIIGGISVDDAHAPDPLLATAEVYDPATNTFTAVGPMTTARGSASMALLPDGRVLVVGGTDPETGSAELFDPATGRFTPVSPLPGAGPHPSGGEFWPDGVAAAVMLPDGRVLVPGRRCMESAAITEGRYPTASAIYDPGTETFTPSSPMPHCVETATALPDGRVFLTAFWGDINWSGIYDPVTDTMTETSAPPAGRYIDVVALADGRVLVVANGLGWIFQ